MRWNWKWYGRTGGFRCVSQKRRRLHLAKQQKK
jgi:hypothetical protein